MDYYEFIKQYGKQRIPDVSRLVTSIGRTYHRVTSRGESAEHLRPSEEWISDNYYMLKELAETLEEADAKSKGQAKHNAYLAALFIVLNTEGQATRDNIIRYADCYEEYHALTIPELGAFPDMLRLALLERMAFLCEQTENIAGEQQRAEQLYFKFTELTGKEQPISHRELDVLFTSVGEITPAFADSLLKTASSVTSDTTPLRSALARRLAGGGLSVQRLIETAHRTQIRLGAEMGNCIRSLSELRDLCMDEIISRLNRVEQILGEDPTGIFTRMSRDTKDEYIRCVYLSAKQKNISPVEEALAIVETAVAKGEHVGEHIPGLLPDKRKEGGKKPRVGLTLFTLLLCILVPVIGPAFFLMGVLAGEIFRCVRTRHLRVRVMPSMDFGGVIPEDIRVMLVIPGLISDEERAGELMRQLQCMVPAGRASNLYCALVGDLPEWDSPKREGDEVLIQSAEEACRALNQAQGEAPHYFVYMRKRVYCKTEGKYSGRERKRGALLDFGNYLDEQMAAGKIPKIHYVITVDADSILTYSAMVRLVEQMEHPLNKPMVDDTGSLPVVTRGHAIIAPSASIFSADREITPFARLMGGENGFSGYGGRTSEYYFDKTGCGIYSGKGIYIPDLYRLLLEAPFAPETLLSHDLIEGAFLRAGFASEVRLYESFPRDVLSYLKRMHRWIRGDWQLIPYMRKSFRDRRGVLRKNPIGATYLRIMNGNLRASAAPVFSLLLLVSGLLIAPGLWWIWSGLFLLYGLREFLMNPCMASLARSGIELLLLPEKAYRCGDAIARTLYRVFYSRKKLLSWVTARDAEKKGDRTIFSYYRQMTGTGLVGLVVVLLSLRLSTVGAVCMLALGVLWFFAPAFFYRLGVSERKVKRRSGFGSLSRREREEITVLARKIWAYYEDYALPGDHYLPPDNVQFKPVYGVAHRTSPTNIGFMILSTAIAAAFGYMTPEEAYDRLSGVMDTLSQMEKMHGHLYNWYDTISLTPLEPRFVSSVDSGNLVACMLAACGILMRIHRISQRESLRETAARYFSGLSALCTCVSEASGEEGRIRRTELEQFERLLQNAKTTDGAIQMGWKLLLSSCRAQATPRSESTDAAIYRGKLLDFCEARAVLTKGMGHCSEIPALIQRMKQFCTQTDFSFLFNREKGIFSIGWHVREGRLSDSHYDICVSEARLMSAVAAAKGDVPEEHFTRMSRQRGDEGRGVLQSWSGTAFEYLMPDLFLKAPEGSLWDETTAMMLEIQMQEGQRQGVPWGVSESCYNVMDLNMNYKYKAFGVPALSVHGKNDFSCVAAPYASIMAISRIPERVLRNLRAFRGAGAWGRYGYYEAVDYTRGRKGVVYCYMAHHLGMSLCGIANLVAENLVSEGLQEGSDMSALRIYAQEKRPKGYSRHRLPAHPVKTVKTGKKPEETPVFKREERAFSGGSPAVNILSNGRYTVVTDDDGGGLSRLGDMFLTKYSAISELNRGGGVRLYVGAGQMGRIREGVFYPEKTAYKRNSEVGCVEEEVCVCAEDDTEIRMLQFTDWAREGMQKDGRRQSVTAFAEISMNTLSSYRAHPSFSDLFITTEALYDSDRFLGLVAKRRPRGPSESPVYAFFGLFTDSQGAARDAGEYDTDLCAVYGRNNDSGVPEAVRQGKPLTGTVGAPVTPCFAVRRPLEGDTRYAWLCTGFANNTEECRSRLLKYREFACAKGAFELARTRTLVEREHIGLKPGEWRYFMDLSGSLLGFGAGSVQSGSSGESAELLCESAASLREKLYAFGISGERPLITVMMRRIENSNALEKMVRLWCMLSFRAFPVDLVIVAFDDGSYLSPIRELADRLAQRAISGAFGAHGEIVVVVPAEGKSVQPLIAASNLVFWM